MNYTRPHHRPSWILTFLLIGFLAMNASPVFADGNGNSNGNSNGNANGNANGNSNINGGNPVPEIANNSESANFITERIASDALALHGESYANALQSYVAYAARLAQVLSQLTPAEQNEVFYGQ